jgi:rare lipoprotein A
VTNRDPGFGIRATLVSLTLAAILSACTGARTRGGGGQDDGPVGPPPVNLDKIADAKPRSEPLNPGANHPYTALGRKYAPYQSLQPYRQRGIASWYGRKFHGKLTSSGERYDMYAMTAAHTILPIPSYARVTNLANGRSIIVRVNDRGPFHADRIIDLSYAAAYKLGYVTAGSAKVEVEAILPGKSAAASRPPELKPAVATG